MPSQELRQVVGRNIDRGISARNWTNRQVGDAIGKTEHQVWRWRRAKHIPEPEMMFKLAELLFAGDMGELYRRDGDKVPTS